MRFKEVKLWSEAGWPGFAEQRGKQKSKTWKMGCALLDYVEAC